MNDRDDAYLAEVCELPAPTPAQIARFAEFVAGAHSWYKHLPVGGPGVPFLFYIDPQPPAEFWDISQIQMPADPIQSPEFAARIQRIVAKQRENPDRANYFRELDGVLEQERRRQRRQMVQAMERMCAFVYGC